MLNLRFIAAALAMLSSASAMADGTGAESAGMVPFETKVAAQDPSKWHFNASPYIWAAGISGKVGQFNQPSARVKSSFNDVLSDLDIAFMGAFEARRGRYSVIGDLFYAKTSVTDSNPSGHLRKDIDITSKTFSGLLGGGYSFLLSDRGNLDVIGGARVWYASTKLSVHGGLLDGRTARDSDTWVDPVGGLRGTYFLSDSFYLTGWGVVGAGQSKLDWDVAGAIGYKAGENISILAGYRAMGVDYSHQGFVYDVIQRGPMIGMSYRF